MSHERCSRCTVFFDSHCVYEPKDMVFPCGTKAQLCHRCAEFLFHSGHLAMCVNCGYWTTRGHACPFCLRLPLVSGRPRIWFYSKAPKAAHRVYSEIWKKCKAVRRAEILHGAMPVSYQFGYGDFATVGQKLREFRQALHRRINLKAGIRTEYLGRKVTETCPQRLRGYLTAQEQESKRQRERWTDA